MSQKIISDFFKDPVGHGSTKRQNTTNVECVSIQVSLPALPSKDHPPIRPEEEGLDEPAMLTAAAPSVDSVAATSGEASTSYSLSEEPFQPKDFSFPARRFANENFSRSFKAGWFSKWPWIHYLKDTDRAVCFVCCSAMEKKLISAERMREGVFMKGGFGNWRKAGDKFRMIYGVDNADHLPTGIVKTLHMSRFVVVFTSIKAFVLSLKEGGKVHQRHSHVPTAGSVCEWW
ncbi:unnamed protein product [Arctogadus glacialis]